MWETGHSLETFRYQKTCHISSMMILPFKSSTAVRYNIIPHEFKSDTNFTDTFATHLVLIDPQSFFVGRKTKSYDQTGQATFLQP